MSLRDRSEIRVLVVFSSAAIGGAEKSLTRMTLANGDPRIGYTLATFGRGEEWRSWAAEQGIETCAFPIFGGGLPRPVELQRFVAFCGQLRPDIVYVVGMRAALAVRVLRPWLPRTRIVHAIRSSFPRGTPLARRMRMSEFLLRYVTDHYVANSRKGAETLEQVIRIDPRRISVIHNGIEMDRNHRWEAPEAKGAKVVVVANLNAFKGHVEFLRIVALVRARVPELQVTLVGRDDLGGAVQREIQKLDLAHTISLAGYQADPREFVAASHVFALPSRTIEGFPTAVMEAMAMGRPVVAYRIGGLPELVKSGENGWLVEPDNDNAFADALVRLLTDRELATGLGRAASATVAAEFSLEECARQHALLWRTLVEGQLMTAVS